MKRFMLGVVLGLTMLAVQPLNADESLESALKKSSSGTVSSRFRGGWFLGAGYQGRIGGDGDTRIQGFLLEGGAYMLFNPVRNYFDMELGISGKYNGGAEVENTGGKVRYYSGLQQLTVYAGTVFRLGETKRAISVGVSKALTISEVQSDEAEEAGLKEHDLENGVGAYIEYQTDELAGTITFIRVEVERIDIVSDTTTDKDTVASIVFGVKY